jgi:endonuclease YncB( thermonuclease family)
MGLIRLLLRAFARSRRPKLVVVGRDTSAIAGPASRQASGATLRRTTRISILEVRELRGRAWVIDGDTIDIGGTRIRLAGIDAPELDHPYGRTARWALIRLCKDQEIRAVFHGEMSHDRTVATCYLPDGRDLSAEMVKAGMAIDWRKFSGGKYAALEPPDIRRKLWRCDARQRGRMPPPSLPD